MAFLLFRTFVVGRTRPLTLLHCVASCSIHLLIQIAETWANTVQGTQCIPRFVMSAEATLINILFTPKM